jgi:hypothetical protein
MDLKVLKKLGEASPYYRYLNMDILEVGNGSPMPMTTTPMK